MDSLNDKIILITGSTEGIGKQTAIDLAAAGASIIVHGRNEEKARKAWLEVTKHAKGNKIHYAVADFSSLAETKKMAEDLLQLFPKIDVLINNAGVYKYKRELTPDGFEMTFAVNHLAHFLLTNLLIDLIKKSDYKRIINVASQAHASHIDFDNLQGEKYYDGYDAYSRSKLCNILFTYMLAEKLKGTGISANALHPGVIRTKLLREGWGFGGASVETGSKTSVYLAVSKDVENITGAYFINNRISNPAPITHDISVQQQLWRISEEIVKQYRI